MCYIVCRCPCDGACTHDRGAPDSAIGCTLCNGFPGWDDVTVESPWKRLPAESVTPHRADSYDSRRNPLDVSGCCMNVIQRHRLCSRHEQMKTIMTILLAGLLLLIPAVVHGAASPNAAQKLSQRLLTASTTAPADSVFDVLVSLGAGDPHSTDRLATAARTLDKRYRTVSHHLRHRATEAQSRLEKRVVSRRFGSETRIVRRFWIANLVQVQTTAAGLVQLAESADIVAITDNATIDLIEPVALGETSVADATMANLEAVGANAAWADGWTGKGRLVASIDTGVEGDHPALQNRWRGIHGDTSAAWLDPFNAPAPMDNNGHGTHVMGVMVGRTDTDTIGVAPDAEWINAAVIDRGNSLSTTIADILDALQWIVDPDGNPATTDDVPDVVCNSWGISQQIINPCDPVFFDAIDNVEAMGIVCVFAAGNEGPNSMSIRNPADRATSPTSSFSVGAVDATIDGLPVPSFSSRGPSACDGVSVKPEMAAPGVAIYSSYKGHTYRTMNGTSMAAPFVAGTVALMRQINPNLTPEQIKSILLSSATDLGPSGEDNEYGHGLLDLPEALSRVPVAVAPSVALASYVVDDVGNAILAPGEISTLSVEITIADADVYDLYGTISPLTS
ncbi:MAG: S8 family serine peptidase, partial [candidate division Zixibacteria bacterium]|nr:S8 family serine peptidase [candidate division Zixibacteria bacterium]